VKTATHVIPRVLAAIAILSGFFLLATVRAAEAGWVNLFDGKTLDGWEQHSGKALYRVEDGAIVGKTVINTQNSFLCTKKTYGDFVLEFEFKVAPDMNSGVQFRSEYYTKETETVINGTKKRKFPADRVLATSMKSIPHRAPTRVESTTKHAAAGSLISRTTPPRRKRSRKVSGISPASNAAGNTSKRGSTVSKRPISKTA